MDGRTKVSMMRERTRLEAEVQRCCGYGEQGVSEQPHVWVERHWKQDPGQDGHR